MSRGYCILEIGYEYNGTGYDRQDGGNPKVVYRDEHSAKLACFELNAQAFKDYSYYKLSDYTNGYSFRRSCSESAHELAERLRSMGYEADDADFEGYDWTLPRDMSIDDIKKIVPLFDIEFYRVVPIEIKD